MQITIKIIKEIICCFLIMSHAIKKYCKFKSIGVNALRINNVILIEIMLTVEMNARSVWKNNVYHDCIGYTTIYYIIINKKLN